MKPEASRVDKLTWREGGGRGTKSSAALQPGRHCTRDSQSFILLTNTYVPTTRQRCSRRTQQGPRQTQILLCQWEGTEENKEVKQGVC